MNRKLNKDEALGKVLYKLVRCTDTTVFDHTYLSANEIYSRTHKYIIGMVTEDDFPLDGHGLASYKSLKSAIGLATDDVMARLYGCHIKETMNSFNEGKPVAILRCRALSEVTDTNHPAYANSVFTDVLYVEAIEQIFDEVPEPPAQWIDITDELTLEKRQTRGDDSGMVVDLYYNGSHIALCGAGTGEGNCGVGIMDRSPDYKVEMSHFGGIIHWFKILKKVGK